jgi:hypothetical protein
MTNFLTGLSGLNSITLGGPLSRSTFEPRGSSGFGSILKNLIGNVVGRFSSEATGIDPKYSALIEKQLEMQEQMQLVSLYSNIIKSEHETHMAAVRNVRVG